MRVGDGVARVASLAHLLRAKRVNCRPHDLQEIEGLLAPEPGGGEPEESAPGAL